MIIAFCHLTFAIELNWLTLYNLNVRSQFKFITDLFLDEHFKVNTVDKYTISTQEKVDMNQTEWLFFYQLKTLFKRLINKNIYSL